MLPVNAKVLPGVEKICSSMPWKAARREHNGPQETICLKLHVKKSNGAVARLLWKPVIRQADGAVLVTYGETTVLATVVADRPKPGLDFSLTVNYQEGFTPRVKCLAAILSAKGAPAKKKRWCRASSTGRYARFREGFKNETQVIATVLSHDLENDPDVVAMVAVSAALTISGVPFQSIGGARVGYIDGEYVLNPTIDQMQDTNLDLVVAGTSDAVLMESEADELSEEVALGAVMFGHKHFQPVIEACIAWRKKPPKSRAKWKKKTTARWKQKFPGLSPGFRPPIRKPSRPVRKLIAALRDTVQTELDETSDDAERNAVGGAYGAGKRHCAHRHSGHAKAH